MELATIIIDPEEAKKVCAEYEEAFRRERNIEDKAMAQGYRAAARGLPIIELSKVIAAGGCFPENGLPKLAVARADAKICLVTTNQWINDSTTPLSFYSDPDRWPSHRGATVGSKHVAIKNRPEWLPSHGFAKQGETIVPSVPPRFRPSRSKLGNFHVLWEVEKWRRIAPVDPALIRHIRGDLWSVLAVWDLTDLERAVLAERA